MAARGAGAANGQAADHRVLGRATAFGWSTWIAAFVQRLRELGWIEGRTVIIEYRWAEGRSDRYAHLAAELVSLKVDVIVTAGAAVLAAKQATSVIPIVFALANDPVGSGFVASLARPGGNVTGLSNQSADLAAKRLELLREVVPNLRRLAIMANVAYPAAALEMHEVAATARTVGLDVDMLEIRRANDITPAFETLKGGTAALYVCTEPLVLANRTRINTLALGARLPTIHAYREYLECFPQPIDTQVEYCGLPHSRACAIPAGMPHPTCQEVIRATACRSAASARRISKRRGSASARAMRANCRSVRRGVFVAAAAIAGR
jgi:ABC transporter substrate binding protein